MPRKLLLRLGGAGVLVAMVGIASFGLTVWQVDDGGQTLSSPIYSNNGPQPFIPGPEFKLIRKAAAMQANHAERLRQSP